MDNHTITTWHPSITLDIIEKALNVKADYISDRFPCDHIFSSITTDSREVENGGIFIAVTGSTQDGKKYIPMAMEKGALLIIAEGTISADILQILKNYGGAYLKVENSRTASAKIAQVFFDYPADHLLMVGVTGTNGKTTTATLLYDYFTNMGFTCGLIGTVENRIATQKEKAKMTTPGPIALQQLLRRMVEAGCTHAFMEVSSHALHQKRIEGIKYSAAIFTNLTRDHLDYHKDMLEYQKAKKMLFDSLDKDAFAIVNADDKHAQFMLQNCSAKTYSYGLQAPSNFSAKIIERNLEGTEILIDCKSVWLQMVGKFNIYNLLAVYATARLLLPNKSQDELLLGLSQLKHVSGRFEVIRSPFCTAIVDYAHTPDAIAKILETTREIVGFAGRIISVIGAGGDRDKGKRPLMTREALNRSNFVILTSDNPRTEDPESIIADMKEGTSAEDQTRLLSIVNRREAIRTAINLAHNNDVVLVAGKGHEDYQEINGTRYHFDDREEIRTYISLKSRSL